MTLICIVASDPNVCVEWMHHYGTNHSSTCIDTIPDGMDILLIDVDMDISMLNTKAKIIRFYDTFPEISSD